MHKRWLLLGATLLMAVLAVAFVACGDDEDEEVEPTPTAEEIETPPAGETPAETPAPGAEIAPITMNEVNGSGVTGSATITETGVNVAVPSPGHTQVVVTIDGGLEPGSHLSHVNLSNVEAGEDGAGIANTSDPLPPEGGEPPPFSEWLEDEHYVAVHALNGDVVACGDVVAATD